MLSAGVSHLERIAFQVALLEVRFQRNAGRIFTGRSKGFAERVRRLEFLEATSVDAAIEYVDAVVLADCADVVVSVARFELKRAGDCLPGFQRTAGHVPNGDLHHGKSNDTTRPEPHVGLGRLVRTGVATVEQLRGPAVEVGAVGKAIAAELTGLVHVC